MGKCIYCGIPAGLLSRSHKQCKILFKSGKKQINSILTKINDHLDKSDKIIKKIELIANDSNINNENIKKIIINNWDKIIDKAFEDDVLSKDEESALTEVIDHFSLSQEELDKKNNYTKFVKGSVLREVLDGNTPERLDMQSNLPFNFLKNEKLIWLFQDVDYYEERTRTQYVGGSKGFSVRIAKGLYYRQGAFKGERVKTSENTHVDNGLLGVTNKHLYFSGSTKKFRIKYQKIVSFDAYSDGIGVHRDAATAKPQTFVTNDGWFTYNLITNLAQMS